MDTLKLFYHHLADQFLALGSTGATETPLGEAELVKMRGNFEANPQKDGPAFVPGKCNVLTTYIPVKRRPLVKFLSETVEKITPLFPDNVPYHAVPPFARHISLVMIQDIRPVDMNDEAMNASALSKREGRKVTRLFAKTMRYRQPEKYDLKLYGTFFSPRDGAMLAVFEDDCQTCRLRAEIAGGLQGFRKGQQLKHSKDLLHMTLLRPLAQLPPDLLRALQDKQRELFPLKNMKLTLPVRRVALGKESRWMHAKVKELSRARVR